MQSAANNQQLSRAEQQRWSIPQTAKFQGPFPFGSMNRQASRMALPDPEAFWVENIIKVGDGNMRAVPDAGPPLYTKPVGDTRTMLCFAWFNIGLTDYCAMFFNDGSAVQVDTAGAASDISPALSGAFYTASGSYPATVGWGGIYLLISNNNTNNSYWAWDGSILYGAGSISPQIVLTSGGQNYVATPNLTIFGGAGSGIALTPVIENGSVIALTVTNPGTGYLPGDVVQVRFDGGGSDEGAELTAVLAASSVDQIVVLNGGSGYGAAPTVVITGGGGAGATATATVSGGGVVTGVAVTAGGTGYTSAPTISFTPVLGGTGAVGEATLVPATVASVTIVHAGTNFFGIPTLTLTGGGGTGAVATAHLSGPGPVETITITNGGSGYTSLPVVTITDGGAGTGATAVVTGAVGGRITEITVTAGGSDYTAPIVGFTGGGGSGLTADGNIGAGDIASVTVDHPGAGYTDAPAVIVQSGLNGAASAILALMPFGVSGDSIETYNNMVWVQNPFGSGAVVPSVGGVRVSSAPNSISDFATSDGGLLETVTNRFLRRHLTAIRQSNGFLYPFGDSSADVVSNVQVSGNPPSKTLTDQNTDPQTGTHWRDTLQDFSRTVLFGNAFGIFGLFGGAVTKISGKMDLVFSTADFPTGESPVPPTDTIPVTPSSAVANLYNRKVYLFLAHILDPFTRSYRNAMITWNEQDWSIVSQSPHLVYIGTREHNSDLKAWGTDGNSLYPLMTVPGATQKIFCSKLWGAAEMWKTNNSRLLYVQAENFADPNRAPLFTFTVDTEYASFPAPASPSLAGMPAGALPANATAPVANSPLLIAQTGDIPGQQLGFTLRSTDPDFALYNVQLATEDVGAFFG